MCVYVYVRQLINIHAWCIEKHDYYWRPISVVVPNRRYRDYSVFIPDIVLYFYRHYYSNYYLTKRTFEIIQKFYVYAQNVAPNSLHLLCDNICSHMFNNTKKEIIHTSAHHKYIHHNAPTQEKHKQDKARI